MNMNVLPKEGVVLKLKVKTYNKDFEAHKTERQWALKGYVPKADVKGVELWANRNCQNKYVYYSPDEVELATKEQLDTFFKPEREKAKAYRERKKAEKEQERQEIEEKLNYYQGLVERLTKLTKELYPKKEYPKEIVIDTETTGLDMFEDELLQVSIIDTDGNVVFDSYIKPIRHSEWYEAQAVNNISPAMVADAPSIYEKAAEINAIISQADLVIGYNVGFDLMMLANSGVISTKGVKSYDVMEQFAEIYGEWSEWHQNYKWQKLTKAAEYFGYDWGRQKGKAHNSLADCFATLFVKEKTEICQKKWQEEKRGDNKWSKKGRLKIFKNFEKGEIYGKQKEENQDNNLHCNYSVFFIATIVFCILLKRAGTGITDFFKIGMGWSIVWAMIIHFSLQKLVFKKRQSK